MSSENNTLADWYNNASVQINRYLTLGIFCFGVVGNILNILVLSQRTLRKSPCAWLFFISSFSNLISIVFGLTTRIQSGWDLDLTDTLGWLCKLRSFTVFTSRTIAFRLITLATIDRWLSSCINVKYRKMSSIKNSKKGAILIILTSSIIYAQMFYCYEANLMNAPLKCYGKTVICRHLNDLIYALVTVLCPLFFMFIFGIMTVLNIRQSQRRVQVVNGIVLPQNNTAKSTDNEQKRFKKKTNRHLLSMLLVQVLLSTLLTLPQAIQKIYSTSTTNDSSNLLDQAINSFIYSFVLLLSFIANGMPFYIYTLCGGKIFREALFNLIKMLRQQLLCRTS